jgi:ThiF family
MPIDVRITERDWLHLRERFTQSFRPGFPPETGAIGVLGECHAGDRCEFLVVKVFWPGPGDLKVARNGALVFDSSYIRRAHLMMRSKGLAGLITLHTHPHSDRDVGFSLFDVEQDPELIANLTDLEPHTRLVSVVVGKNSQCGRLWETPTHFEPINELIVVGDRLAYYPLNGRSAPPPPSPAAVFDRALSLTNAGALNRLASITVAIVGASGTGTLVGELLARAGCTSLMVVDDDVTKDINLNRMLYATMTDAEQQTPKVEVLRRGIEGLGLGCRVEPVLGNILDREVLTRLREADAIFGCVDKAYPRQLLSEFSFRYLRPYIDVGSEIGGDEQGIVSLNSRTNYVAPGRNCLLCTGLVTPRQLLFESLTYEEQQREIALGYSDDLKIKSPAVMDLNMRAASLGVMLLRHLLQPFLLEPIPVTISENLVTYTMLAIPKARSVNPRCPTCQANPQVAYGDCGDAIGLEKAQVEAILAPKD